MLLFRLIIVRFLFQNQLVGRVSFRGSRLVKFGCLKKDSTRVGCNRVVIMVGGIIKKKGD